MEHDEIKDLLAQITTVREAPISLMAKVNLATITVSSITCKRTFILTSIAFELFYNELYATIERMGETLKLEFQFDGLFVGNNKLFYASDKFKTLIVEVPR